MTMRWWWIAGEDGEIEDLPKRKQDEEKQDD